MKSRKALTLVEVILVVAALALLICVLRPVLAFAAGSAERAVCAANLRAIGQGCHIYAEANQDWFPHSFYRPATGLDANYTWIQFIGQLSKSMTLQKTTNTWMFVHPSRSLFMLVIGGHSAPADFVCPSSGDTPDPLRNRPGGPEVPALPGISRFDFRGFPYLSYGYQLPFGNYGKPRLGVDPRMVLIADKGPYFQAGTMNSTDGSIPDTQNISMSPPGFTVPDSDLLGIAAERWRPYNSRNHNGEGQNVLFADNHVDFVRRPIVGVNNDNIYTEQFDFTLSGAIKGRTPRTGYGPLTNTDTIIVP